MVLSTELATLPALFVSHGMPTLAVAKTTTTNTLAKVAQNLPTPKAIVIMSAHWLTEHVEISSASHLQLWHDYKLPNNIDNLTRAKLIRLNYSAKGAPELAENIMAHLQTHKIEVQAENLRPLDHGVWTPLVHMYPHADVPIVQVSLPKHFDAYACYQLGALFAYLRKQQILIIGSGNITHNLAGMSSTKTVENKKTTLFKQWLLNALRNDVPAALDWQQAPYAKENHPSTEHLLPLFFALGTGQLVSLVHASTEMHTLGMDIYRFD